MFWLERALLWNTQIFGLIIRQLGQFGTQFGQMQTCDFFIQMFRQDINLQIIVFTILPELHLRQHLIGK